MAYCDHKSASSERAVAIALVTALQVGAFVALMHGLAVTFIPQAGVLAAGSYTGSIRWVIPK